VRDRTYALLIGTAVLATLALSSGMDLAWRLVVIAIGSVLSLRARVAEPVSAALDRIEREERRIARAVEERAAVRPDATRETLAGRRHREAYLAAVSHELRTPLNAILGFTQVLLAEIDGPLSVSQREDVQAISDAGAHLRALVEEVIGESAGSAEARDIGPISIDPMLRELGRGLEAQLRGRPITLRLDIAADLPKPVGDARRVRQILWNLGTNAVRYTERGEIVLGVRRETDRLVFSVRDTGRGIAKDDLGRIFGAGERIETHKEVAPRARAAEGWGLGLAIAREMAEFHRGTITVESELGVGSTFTFTMPAEGTSR
jgi:signal transduction histidine kinase